MPTYDYVCAACGHKFEHFQSMTSRRLRKCPACGKQKLERLVGSGAGVIFKGSGFYETDYKRAGKPGGDADGKPAAKPDANSDAKPETKPETKPTAKSDGASAPKSTGGSAGASPKD